MSSSSSYAVQTVVRGYHVYKDIWNAATGQILPCQCERGNVHDPYAVGVVERGVTVGHVPRAISSVCSLFLGRNGTIMCEVIGARHYSIDLPQGGLEIPCKLIFRGEAKLIVKVQKLLQEAVDSGLLALSSTSTEPEHKSPVEHPIDEPKHPHKKCRVGECDLGAKTWLQLDGILLTQDDKEQLSDGRWLNDKHINVAQLLLRKQFPHIDGWKETLLLHRKQEKIKQGVQIIHSRGNHWIVASTLRCSKSEVQIFDSLHTSVDTDSKNVISNIFQTDEEPEFIMAETSKQNGVNNCGLFAIATATALAFDLNPVKFDQSKMRTPFEML